MTCSLRKPVLYLSHYLKGHRQEYYDRLQAVRDTGDWEGWIRFFLEGVRQVAEEAALVSRHIVELCERHRAVLVEHLGRSAANALKVLEHLYDLPVVTVNQVKKLTGVSYPAASALVQRFVEHNILAEATGRARNRRFRYGEYIGLFSE